jgi:hypothetical protein
MDLAFPWGSNPTESKQLLLSTTSSQIVQPFTHPSKNPWVEYKQGDKERHSPATSSCTLVWSVYVYTLPVESFHQLAHAAGIASPSHIYLSGWPGIPHVSNRPIMYPCTRYRPMYGGWYFGAYACGIADRGQIADYAHTRMCT